MKYTIVYETEENESGEKASKWIPSAHYMFCAEYFLERMKENPDEEEFLIVPFILTLCACLEATLCDRLIIDTFEKHGKDNYKSLVQAYLSASLANKLSLVVAVLTDNSFQLRKDSKVAHNLKDLVANRNKITHSEIYFDVHPANESETNPALLRARAHPISELNHKKCAQYYEALIQFENKFFAQYDDGHVVENDVIKELERIGNQTD